MALYDKTGTPLTFASNEEMENAIKTGQALFQKGQKIQIADEDFNLETIPAEQAKLYLEEGYSLNSTKIAAAKYAKDNDGIIGTLKQAGSSFINQALMGVPEIVGQYTQSEQEKMNKEALAAQNPLGQVVGGVAGFGTSLLYGGGIISKAGSILGKGAETLTTKVLGDVAEQNLAKRILAKATEHAADMGVQTALFEAPRAVAEAAMGDPEEASEHIVSALGAGALLGGIASPFTNTVGKWIGKKAELEASGELPKPEPKQITSLVGKKDLTPSEVTKVINNSEALRLTPEQELANKEYANMGLEPLTAVQQQKTVLGQPTPEQYAEGILKSKDTDLYNHQLTQQNSLNKVIDGFKNLGESNLEQAGQIIKDTLDKKAGEAGRIIGDRLETIKTQPIEVELTPPTIDMKRILTKEKAIVNEYAAEFADAKTYDDLAALNTKIAQTSADRELGSAAKSALGDIKAEAKNIFVEKMKLEGFANPEKEYEQYAMYKSLDKKGGVLSGTNKLGGSEKVIDKITSSGEALDEFKKIAENLDAPELMQNVKDNYLSDLFNDSRWQYRWNKEKTGEVVKKLLTPEERASIDRLITYKKQLESTTAVSLNPSKTGFMNLIGKAIESPRKLINESMQENYASSAEKYKELIGVKSNTAGVSKGLSSAKFFMGSVVDKASKQLAEIPKAVDGLFGTGTSQKITKGFIPAGLSQLVTEKNKDKAKQVRSIQEMLQPYSNDPEATARIIATKLNPLKDELSESHKAMLTTKIVQIANYITAKAPKLPDKNILDNSKTNISDSKYSEWNKVVETALNPYSTLRYIKNGTITNSQINALKELHPKLYAKIQTQISEKVQQMNEAGKTLPYSTKIKVSKILGVPIDNSLKNVTMLQANYQTQEAKEQQGATTPRLKTSDMKAPTLISQQDQLANRRI